MLKRSVYFFVIFFNIFYLVSGNDFPSLTTEALDESLDDEARESILGLPAEKAFVLGLNKKRRSPQRAFAGSLQDNYKNLAEESDSLFSAIADKFARRKKIKIKKLKKAKELRTRARALDDFYRKNRKFSDSDDKKAIKASLNSMLDSRELIYKEAKERSLQLAEYLEKLGLDISADQDFEETLQILEDKAKEEFQKINNFLNNLLVKSEDYSEESAKKLVQEQALHHAQQIKYARRCAYAIFADKAQAFLRSDKDSEQKAKSDLVLAKKTYKQISSISVQAKKIIKKLKQEQSELKPVAAEDLSLNLVNDLDDVIISSSPVSAKKKIPTTSPSAANFIGGAANRAGYSVIASTPVEPIFSKPNSASPSFRQRVFNNKVSVIPQKASVYQVE